MKEDLGEACYKIFDDDESLNLMLAHSYSRETVTSMLIRDSSYIVPSTGNNGMMLIKYWVAASLMIAILTVQQQGRCMAITMTLCAISSWICVYLVNVNSVHKSAEH